MIKIFIKGVVHFPYLSIYIISYSIINIFMIVIDYTLYLDNKKNELFGQVNYKISFFKVFLFLNVMEKINNLQHDINNIILFLFIY